MDLEFKVIVGLRGYKIVDTYYGVVYGSYAAEEDADYYCDMLNQKWKKMEVRS